uniref:Uncharacterized protein n=1 Tax=Alexandrium monilatum TaxID=311494 RepID=A0A7S4UPT4_9DINO
MFAGRAVRQPLSAAPAPLHLILPFVCLHGVAGGIIAPEEERQACPTYQQMTCFLDVLEKACAGDEAPPFELIQKNSVESAWLCCCPLPYKQCEQGERDASCDAAFAKYLEPLGESDGAVAIRNGLQQVRGALREAGGEPCKAMAPADPLTTCGSEAAPPMERSVVREDLFCEMLTWQREELGDGNFEEFKANGCPWPERQGDGEGRRGTGIGEEM